MELKYKIHSKKTNLQYVRTKPKAENDNLNKYIYGCRL